MLRSYIIRGGADPPEYMLYHMSAQKQYKKLKTEKQKT